ncbi:gliding motility-associated C-terminal domain-containing protein [Flavobacterium cellulosilyticum]|uniref:Gliding motility-associated C-terminal domain-containing protein n=1 Tax=Flavobacterium cellulosilyticum TaxID=2541731 RepID=A0A4R5CKV9_9FLAO|nr:gliding motility-associated C-terminal domain-containing protein [Flavobacterium cellulosilyticum]TDD99260.1 gliding motility-associated C-terminal domain-containing protein [Flavobacterium cellulosilyticum]
MKKNYLLIAIFLNLFTLYSFANSLKNKNNTNDLKEAFIIHLISPISLLNNNSNAFLTNTLASTVIACEGDNITLIANPSGGVAPYTSFSWTGPNGFVSTAENPIINNIKEADAGDYIVTYTDAAASTFQNTISVIVTKKIIPTFDATVFAICNGGFAPILSTTSTNGIKGSWSPSVVSNTATNTYIFTPDAGQCANNFSLTIYVINNVTPTFTLPKSICSNNTPPLLLNISNNGIVGTWSPSTVSNTNSGSYIFTPSLGQCALPTTLQIIVNPLSAIFLPAIPPICSGEVLAPLPTTSNNGVTGTWSPAINNTATTTYTFTPTPGQCTTTPTTMTIVVNPTMPTFTQVAPICSGEVLAPLPTTSNNGVTGTWSPAMNNTATTTYTFTPTTGQCATSPSTMTIVVNPIVATFTQVAPICSGEVLAPLPTSSNNGVTGTWSPAINNTATTTYTFTPTPGQCTTTPTTMTIVVNPTMPTFTQVAPICSGEVLAPLPTTSNNGVTGTWSPAMNNTATTTYTFTPTTGQCATSPASMTIVVNPIVATFTQVAPICSGEALAPLPTTSNNGVTGTWSPAINNTASTTYTFTPTPGQCTTTPTTMTIVVNPTMPTFTQVAPICSGQALASLSTTSNNGVTGTWSPAMNNTATTTYTFTPTTGQCATSPSTMTIVVNPLVATFTQVAPICSGEALAPLPTTSNNNVTGTWSPALNNTATTTYTFTPNTGQCTTSPSTMTIVVNPLVATFTQVAPKCSGEALAPLPTTSNNGVTGTWSPALNNTATTTYTFTPNTGQCTISPATMTIVVNSIMATFTQVAPICSGQALAPLPTTSNNGVTGTWSPAMNNTATTTYTFTPTTGQCATSPASMTIVVNPIVATFTQVAPICSGEVIAVLPTTSNNGVTGNWSPAMNKTATTTYTFTPTTGQCTTTPATMTIVVNQKVTPTFNSIASICSGETLAPLPTTSNNGVTGIWSPAMNNTATTTYTFTPTTGQCTTTPSTMTIVVNQKATPTFNSVGPICSGDTLAPLPTTSNNAITGTWSPVINNTATTTYTFTPTTGICATTTVLTVTVNPNIVPTFNAIPDVCYESVAPSLPTISTNGITGTWSPTIVSNITSASYTFIPTAGICARKASLSINVNTIVPVFNIVPSICINGTAPLLPSTSTNGITGTWSPSIISNTVSGNYTFTPNANQCATTTALTITVKPILTSNFTAISPICSGATRPSLPLVSTNGVTGTWNPAVVNNLASGIYTFTPAPNECAIGTTMNVTVIPNAIPTFTQIAPICSNTALESLSTTSINGITGTWSPAMNNTTTTTYTFTPTTGQCAITTTMSIIVNQSPTAFTIKTTDVVNGRPDGIIEISNPLNGLAPFQYSVNNSSFTTNPSFTNLAPGDYTITIKDSNNCEYKKGAIINTMCLFPNVITPNNDSYNNTFNLSGCEVERLQLFNRYGREVNSYTNYTSQWDGANNKGERLPDGTYFYVAEIKGGKSKVGWVFISR